MIAQDLISFEQRTGYLPGNLHLAVRGYAAESELMMVLDTCIGLLRNLSQVDTLSSSEEDFLSTFGPVSDVYWGN